MANPILGTTLMAVPVTALYGALNALVTLGLSLNVSRIRGKHKVFLGDGGHKELQAAIRAHGNNAEHVPLLLLLLLIAELCGGSSTALHSIGGALVVSRLAHAAGLLKRIAPMQLSGAVGTYLLEFGLAGYVLWLRPWG